MNVAMSTPYVYVYAIPQNTYNRADIASQQYDDHVIIRPCSSL